MPTRILVALITTFFPSIVFAQPAPGPIPYSDEVVVTASAVEEPLSDVPAAVTVISKEDIKTRAVRDVADILRQVPGLNLSRTGSPGKAVSIFSRGGNSTHTVVMWNGIKINNPYFSGYEFGTFSASGVERIEVVRGPFSALYGSDAMTGVVNIITESSWTGFDASIEVGEDSLRNGQLSGAWSSGNLMLAGGLELREDGGFAPNDDFAEDTFTASAMWDAGSIRTGVRLRYSSWDLGVPTNTNADGSALVPSLERRQDGEELQIHVPFEQTLGSFTWDVTLSRYDRDDRSADPQDPFGLTEADTESTTDRIRVVTRTKTPRLGLLIAGAEYERAEVDDVNTYGVNLMDETRDATSVFVENRLGLKAGAGRVEVSAGFRYDKFDTFGSETSPRLAAAWIFGLHKIRAGFGEGFRAPSIGELYFPFFGNEELQPERSRSLEVGYDFVWQNGTASVTLFDNDFENLIVFDNASFVFGNVGAASSRGLEFGSRVDLGAGFFGGLSYTWLDTEQSDTGDPLLRRPEHSGSIDLAWSRGPFNAVVVVNHGGDRSDVRPVFPYDTIQNEAYTVADVTLRYRFHSFEPYLRVENILDEEYEEVRGFPSAGRRALIGLRYSLK